MEVDFIASGESDGVKQESQAFSTRGPQIYPTSIRCPKEDHRRGTDHPYFHPPPTNERTNRFFRLRRLRKWLQPLPLHKISFSRLLYFTHHPQMSTTPSRLCHLCKWFRPHHPQLHPPPRSERTLRFFFLCRLRKWFQPLALKTISLSRLLYSTNPPQMVASTNPIIRNFIRLRSFMRPPPRGIELNAWEDQD
ncbi:hypothetical protein ACLOJK_007805 [Asimina triloba]